MDIFLHYDREQWAFIGDADWDGVDEFVKLRRTIIVVNVCVFSQTIQLVAQEQ